MGDYISRIEIDRPAAEVFAFVADIRHMPAYLPTVRTVTARGPGHVLVEGARNGRPYRNEGWLRLDPGAMTLEWGAEHNPDYRGSMRIIPRSDDAPGTARIEAQLHLRTPEPTTRQARGRAEEVDRAARDGLEAALAAIKSLCEGTDIARRPTQAERRAAALAADDAARNRMAARGERGGFRSPAAAGPRDAV